MIELVQAYIESRANRDDIEFYVNEWIDRFYPTVVVGPENFPNSVKRYRPSTVIQAVDPSEYERLVTNWCDSIINNGK